LARSFDYSFGRLLSELVSYPRLIERSNVRLHLAVGVMIGLIEAGVLDDLLVPAYVMFAITIPFFVVYARDRKQRWPLIPGGIMAVIGLSFLLAEAAVEYVAAAALILVGVWLMVRQFARAARARSAQGRSPPAPQ
jgi:hypothetical protein